MSGAHADRVAEFTLRGVALGALVTVVFMAANIFMGLKTGMTFSTSIPAAVISMAVLRALGGSNVLESNIVQTQASAAGTLCNVILVLPGIVIIGFWHGFSFWQTTAVCLLGGVLGVMYSVPLRRALVVGSTLPFPEGTAAAEVLRVGDGDGARGIWPLAIGAAAAGGLAFCASGLRVIAEGGSWFFSAGQAVFRVGTGFSLALVGVGYLVGIGACLALLLGVALAWGLAVPVLTALAPVPHGVSPATYATGIWADQVRLMGAGIIAVGGVWTVITLLGPMARSIAAAFASRGPAERHDRDLPMLWVAIVAASLALPLAGLFADFAWDGGHGVRGAVLSGLTAGMSVFTIVFGFLMATVCGYLAGLLGSSSSPISGIGILTTILVALLLSWALRLSAHEAGLGAGGGQGAFVVAAALFVSAVIVTTASIANDNLQDLKTGQLLGASPWRQQAALLVGVAVGSAVIAPLLQMLYGTYGFIGAMPHAGMDAAGALAAPQASLMAAIARGILQHRLPWNMVYGGIAVGVVLIFVEAWCQRRGARFPVLTVGVGMYLPPTVCVAIAIGGVVGWLAQRGPGVPEHERERLGRRGILLGSGFLVGESFVGVVLAGMGSLGVLGSGVRNDSRAVGLGGAGFALAVLAFYRAVSAHRSR